MLKHKIRFVVFRYSHHSPHSGYSRLAEYGISQFGGEVIKVSKPLSRKLIRERLYWRLASGTPGYDRSAMAAELKVASQMISERNCLYHYLYGETTYHYSGLLNNFKGNHILASFHFPPSGIKEAVRIDWHLQKLSAIICLGHTQQEYFSKIVDADKVFYIPLGVDTEYYTPPASFENRDPNLCLFVGDNYRDYPTMRGVIELVAYLRPEINFVSVMAEKNQKYLGSHRNLQYRSRISEAELLGLYHSAALLVMPLHDSIANNAILEGMACGLPQVVSDVGSIRDYVSTDSTLLIPPADAHRMAEAILGVLEDEPIRQRMAIKARARALEYSWPLVIQQLESVYTSLS